MWKSFLTTQNRLWESTLARLEHSEALLTTWNVLCWISIRQCDTLSVKSCNRASKDYDAELPKRPFLWIKKTNKTSYDEIPSRLALWARKMTSLDEQCRTDSQQKQTKTESTNENSRCSQSYRRSQRDKLPESRMRKTLECLIADSAKWKQR